jgi:hypothetical protein
LCALTLQGREKADLRLQNFWKDRRFYYGVSVVLIGFLFSLLSFGAIEGGRSEKSDFTDIKKFVPWAFKKLAMMCLQNFKRKMFQKNQLIIGKSPKITFRNM